ncbi:MAG: hypothetical protein ACLF0G_13000 [Candidatus Brocadiia bacterium]
MGTKLWHGLRKAFRALGLAQNFLLLAVFYFLLFGPLALVVRLARRDLLGTRRADRESFWQERPAEEPSLERARHQS